MKKTSKLGKKHTPLIIGNWKMNPATLEKAEMLYSDVIKSTGKKIKATQVVVAPPLVYIASLQKLSKKTSITLGAQDAFYEQQGAFTGETSISMLKSISVTHIILGHSERRALGETDAEIHTNALAILKSGLNAVVCIGEKKRDTQGDYFSFVQQQLELLLQDIPKAHLGRLVIAYEPIWAIGTGVNATVEDVQEMKLFIQKILADSFGRSAVSKVRILYGGSVKQDNAQSLLEEGEADGFLIGGASLKPAEFAEIITISETYAAG